MINSAQPWEIIKDIHRRQIEGTRVLFINMPLRETAAPNTTPEGPLLMATRLIKEYGALATIIDLNGYRIKDRESKLSGLENGRHLTEIEARNLIIAHTALHGEPVLVALSGMITTLRWQKLIAKMVREIFPKTFMVSGGGLATELKAGLFQYIPELDGIAHSEGDDVIVKIVFDAKAIRDFGIDSSISRNLLRPYYQGSFMNKHRFIYHGNRPRNLDALPLADLDILEQDVNGYRMLDYYLANPVWGTNANNSSSTSFSMTRSTTSVSSRGCPFDCAFCFRGAQGERNWGIRSAQSIAQQIQSHKNKYGIDFFGMPDDNFAVNPKRIADMVTLVGPLGIRWGTHTRLDEAADLKLINGNIEFTNPRRVDLMAQAGCIYIGFGAESASPRTLVTMRKGGHILANGLQEIIIDGRRYHFPTTMLEGIRNCQTAGIHANCTWIMAYPGETLEDLKASVAFMLWQEKFYGQSGKNTASVNKKMFTATWYPGTEMGKHPKVMSLLKEVFGIKFDPLTREPICDENLERYILELDDATKLLYHPTTGHPLNYSNLPMDTFLKARDLIDNNRTLEILDI